MTFQNGLAFTIDPTTDGIVDVFPKNGKDFKFDEIYTLLECDTIQRVYVGISIPDSKKKWVMALDEDGKMKRDVKINGLATYFYNNTSDVIVGKVLVCPSYMVKW